MLPVHVKEAPFTVKKNLPGVGVGEWWGKGHCCNAPWRGNGHWSMDNSPTPPQVGGMGLIIDRCFTYRAYGHPGPALADWVTSCMLAAGSG